jgi:hypothetical protein
MLLVCVTFLATTAIYGFLLWLAVGRVVFHLKDNPEAVKAFADHVLIPLFGRRQGDEQFEGEKP